MKYEETVVLGLRVFQLFCLGLVVTGFVWASSDLLLTTILVDAPVTPISVLLMFYGFFGTVSVELVVRLFRQRHGNGKKE